MSDRANNAAIRVVRPEHCHLMRLDGLEAKDITGRMETVKVYNPIPDGQQAAYAQAVMREYATFCQEKN